MSTARILEKPDRFSEEPKGPSLTGRRVVAFSVLGLLVFIVGLALFKPTGFSSAAESTVEVATRLKGADVTPAHIPVLVLTGFAAGLLSGMIGMGGGVLKMSFMVLFLQFDIFFARAISLVTMFCSSSAALWGFIQLRLVTWSFALRMLAAAVPAALVAAIVGNDLHESTLTIVFAFFLIFFGLSTFALTVADPSEIDMRDDTDEAPKKNECYLSGFIGALHGGTCGLLGISGGVVATPMQQLTLRMPLRNAIGNTLLISTAVTFVAGVCVLWLGVSRGNLVLADVLFVDLFMGGGALIGAPLGTYLGQRCNVTMLRLLFVLLTVWAGGSILF